uniref:Guanylate kinase-like domain-containing protein n=1 Tax=Parascaris equorum TaxID=6256 RepID=A0A914RCY0_PAREQ
MGATYSRGFTDAELQQIITASEQLYQIYANYCDMVLVNGNLELAFSELCHAVAKLDSEPCWIPSSWIE